MSNLTNEIPKEETFFQIPKKVHKIILRNSVRDCIVAEHLSVITSELLFTSLNTAIWLMGVNAYCANPQLMQEFIKVLDKYKLSKLDSMNEEILQNSAKKIIKEWKEIISIFNIKNQTYAN